MDDGLDERNIGILNQLALDRGWTGLSLNDIVYLLSYEYRGLKAFFDIDLGLCWIDGDKKVTQVKMSDAVEEMRRSLAASPADPELEGLSEDEILDFAGKKMRDDYERFRPKPRSERDAETKGRGRG